MMRNLTSLILGILLTGITIGCSSMNSADLPPEPALTDGAQITILQTTDVHHQANGIGHVSATQSAANGSYARISAYVNYVRSHAGHPVVLVDSGDWSMGSLYDLTLGQQPLALYAMQVMRYDCITLGNHEFDYTPTGLATFLRTAQSSFGFKTPLVASNMNINGSTDLLPYVGVGKTVTPTHVETLANGLRVGYIGLMGKAAVITAPAAAPVTFTDYSANYTFVQNLVNDLRNNQGCHVVVALSHAGADATASSGEDVDLARHVTGIDVIASGHNHNPLAAARTVANGTWNTQIICAGAYGTNVSRIDLTYHVSAKNTSLAASENQAMTDANLGTLTVSPVADPALTFMVESTDVQLHQGLSPLFTTLFSTGYNPADPATGIYHTVGGAAQDMISNDKNFPVLCPNGLGNLCADGVRATPNGILFKALMTAGWNGTPGDPSYATAAAILQGMGIDTTLYQTSLVATGVIRGELTAGVPLSFADVYNVLPLGMSPDTSQAIPVGYPLISAYMELDDLKKLGALQLVAQSGLVGSDYYLNLSGISCHLTDPGSYDYFKHATAAAVLSITNQKAAAGSASAGQALLALSTLGSDNGAALLAAMGASNPYATAMVKLNDPSPDAGQIAVNLGTLGAVATAAAYDMAHPDSKTLNTLIVTKAIAAIDTVSGFSPMDPACTNAAGLLDNSTRYRISADLYAVLMMGAAQAEFGTAIAAYRAATGSAVLSSADMAGIMGNRIKLDPSSATVQEVKEWMALLLYMVTPPAQGGHFTSGTITDEYASTGYFLDFLDPAKFGEAVTTRNASYPVGGVGQLMTTLGGLQAAP